MPEKSDCALAQIRHRHRPRSHPLSPTLATLGLALLLSACGGGEDGSTPQASGREPRAAAADRAAAPGRTRRR
jgi:hypothetical protein